MIVLAVRGKLEVPLGALIGHAHTILRIAVGPTLRWGATFHISTPTTTPAGHRIVPIPTVAIR
jgi:hypothetical protein